MSKFYDGLGNVKNIILKNQIKEELAEEQKLNKNSTSEIKLTGEQKFLILHYLQFGKEVKKNTHRASLFAPFVELKETTIRPMFSDITKYETEINLNAIIDFFRYIGYHSKAREIEDKLNKPKKK